MGDDYVTTPAVDDRNPAASVDAVTDEMRLLEHAVQQLPAHAVKELITNEVCARCIFRVFNIHEGIYALVSPTTLYSIIEKATELEAETTKSFQKSEVKSNICPICLGVMQFSYHDQRDMLLEKDHAADFAMTVAESVKEKYQEIASFTLEVSLPTIITENESVIVSYMKKKYASEVWFQDNFSFEHIISVKDALKLSIIHSLEILLGVKSSVSDFRIRLTYEHVGDRCAENSVGKNQCNKRIKSGNILVKCTNETVQGGDVSDFNSQLKKVDQPCHMTLTCSMAPVYIGGRYLKLSRNVSQTRWIIDDERKGEASVEEIIGENILPMCNGDGYKFHAAGREDIDVRMLGSGRPFLIEIQNAGHLPSEVSIKEMEKKINSLESSNLVRVKHMKSLGSQGWTLMREGEAEKQQKQYAALVWISRSIKDDDVEAMSSLKDLKVLQRTPIRVLHRRSPLDREKIIHWMKIEKIAGSSQYFLLRLCTQAGTYIKEFVHGDLGRTHPSIGSILGCRAEILRLDVTDVKMDILNE
ncbi:hypothetical protein E3N88_00219 [Mikania micrantha]|uniref:tRNA pseudouridine(55) synthase n=1 Tax=Mikania micrantha TaxID=192012 RepID=A0A5N6PYA9_9ASTR|nr:hypothetical protein E3N88_00219 [Mikania micrantha]